MLVEVLKMNKPDSEARLLYEARQKYLHDEASMLEGAKQAGMQAGMKAGREEGIKEAAKNMLRLNVDISIITQATGLSEQEILALKNME
ncbi:hypothetical protein [Cohnella rhizosphaerae]|uniref:Rpn family recombination-promoting nuclease/putative transposase n=1 Tax=Cohnella rhizosphaerae TaxID=1457232 RepID=A0A9X4KPW0_9BACL|nr:hypothetical protein [Cohnella rhizosphaerae]MDG0809001.1 hypothetical protein [Cohnella rhizosphaerae]